MPRRAPSQRMAALRITGAGWPSAILLGLAFTFAAQAAVATEAGGGTGQEEGAGTGTGSAEVDAAVLAQGSEVFARACTACHQAGGTGIPGQYPPLAGNGNVLDQPDYVQDVVRNGREGEIVVDDITYNGVMPAVGTGLSEDEIVAVSLFVANNLELPEGAETAPAATLTVPEPPASALALNAIAFLLAAGVAALVLAPRVLATTDRVHLPWLDAWMKTAAIVGYFIIAIVVVPAFVMEAPIVTQLPTQAQYLVGSVIWGGGLLIGLVGLWWAQRRKRI